jgi:hypothetical protein
LTGSGGKRHQHVRGDGVPGAIGIPDPKEILDRIPVLTLTGHSHRACIAYGVWQPRDKNKSNTAVLNLRQKMLCMFRFA